MLPQRALLSTIKQYKQRYAENSDIRLTSLDLMLEPVIVPGSIYLLCSIRAMGSSTAKCTCPQEETLQTYKEK